MCLPYSPKLEQQMLTTEIKRATIDLPKQTVKCSGYEND